MRTTREVSQSTRNKISQGVKQSHLKKTETEKKSEEATEKKTETPEKPRVPKDSVPETGDEDGVLWGMDAMTCMWLFIVSGILLLYVAVKKRDNGDSPHCHVLPAKRDKRDCPRCHAGGG